MTNGPLKDVVQCLRSAVLPGHDETSDGELVTAFLQQRDPAALTALVHRHAPMVWGVCRRLLRDHHDVEDAFQATFLILVRKAATIRRKDRVAPWLHGVAHQTALKARAVAARRRRRERGVAELPEPAAPAQDLWNDLRPLLDQALSSLPRTYRAVVVLCDLQGRTRQDVARELGWPEGTVAGRLARARALLAKRLTRCGVAVSGAALAALLAQQAASANVPGPALGTTIKAATLVAAGQGAAAGGISPRVATITEGVLNAMFVKQIAIVIGVLSLVLVVGLGLGVGGLIYYVRAEPAAPKAPDDNLAAKKAANKDEGRRADEKKPDEPKAEEGKLYGLVYLADKPLTGGKVVVVSDGGKTYEGPLDAKGAYTINGGQPIPVGTYKVGIVSNDPLLRKKYTDGKTSGLTAVVTKDNTPASWNLKTNKDEGKLFGLVRVDEKVLIGGKIILYDTDGTTYQGPLDAKGDYTINDGKPIPSDTYKVVIISDDPLLPKKYGDLKTSNLTVTVTNKSIPHSWNLRSEKP